jgi:hypothetical protein
MNSTSSDAPSAPSGGVASVRAPSALRVGDPEAVHYRGDFFARMVAKSDKAALELRGTLTIVVGPAGTIGAGDLVDEEYGRIPVVGTLTGRDTVLLFTLPDGSVLSAEGTAEEDAANGIGAVLGVIAVWFPDGSQSYRLGTWNATRIAPVTR